MQPSNHLPIAYPPERLEWGCLAIYLMKEMKQDCFLHCVRCVQNIVSILLITHWDSILFSW